MGISIGPGLIDARSPSAWASAWADAYTRQAAGSRQAHVAFFGDSITQGFYGSEPYNTEGWVGQIRDQLAALTSVTPGSGWITTTAEYDASMTNARRIISRTGTWTTGTTGGLYQRWMRTTGGTLTLGPVTCDTFRVLHVTVAGGGTWSATVDGGTPQNFTSNAPLGIAVETIAAGSLGSHTLVISSTNAANIFPLLVESIANSSSGVKVSALGHNGAQTSQLIANDSVWASRPMALETDPDLAVLMFGINEWFNGTSTETFRQNLTTAVQMFQSINASVVLCVPPPPDPAEAVASWADYANVIRSVFATEHTGLVDITEAWGTRAASIANYQDGLHPNATGAAVIASLVGDYITAAVV